MGQPSEGRGSLQELESGFFNATARTEWEKSIADINTQVSTLLRLPRELRDVVWAFTIGGNIVKPRYEPDLQLPQPRGTRPPEYRFSLLRVCRQIYAETASLPWTLSLFSFDLQMDYEDFCLDNYGVEIRKYQIRYLQYGLDPLDIHTAAETEDPAYDDLRHHHKAIRISTFPKLERLELLVARTIVNDCRDDDDDFLRRFSLEEVDEAKGKLNKVMRENNPGVTVTYVDFETAGDMRKYWRARTSF